MKDSNINKKVESINNDDYPDFDVKIHYELCKTREESEKLFELFELDFENHNLKKEYFPEDLINE